MRLALSFCLHILCHNMMAQSSDSRARPPYVLIFDLPLTKWPWGSYLATPFVSVFKCKERIIIECLSEQLRVLNGSTNLQCPRHHMECEAYRVSKCSLLPSLLCQMKCRFLQECLQMKKFQLHFVLIIEAKTLYVQIWDNLEELIKKKNNLPLVITTQWWWSRLVVIRTPSVECIQLLPPCNNRPPLDKERKKQRTQNTFKETWIGQSNWLESRKPAFQPLHLLCHPGDPGHLISSLSVPQPPLNYCKMGTSKSGTLPSLQQSWDVFSIFGRECC